jgi:hypothetical protein
LALDLSEDYGLEYSRDLAKETLSFLDRIYNI